MRKRALLVGINKYRNPKAELRGCVNDVRHARELLEQQYGFAPPDIQVITDADAVRAAIISGFEDLTRFAMEGDRIFFWYSGHGTQKYSPAAAEDDQLAECIVPWETSSESLIEDKWFGEQLKAIASRGNAANVTLVFDCCHSGTITRPLSFEKVTEVFLPFQITKNRFLPFTELMSLAPASETEIALRARGKRSRGEFEGMRSIGLSTWDVLSACQDDQEAADTYLEDEFRGAFSYCLVRAIQQDPAINFESLENRIRAELRELLPTHQQEPAFEVRNTGSTLMEIPTRSGSRTVCPGGGFDRCGAGRFNLRGALTEYSAYAGPMVFGPWVNVGSHIGTAHYSISAEPVGSTVVTGEVRYFAVDGNQKAQPFFGSVRIQTGNSIANVEVRFKGTPMGSAVRVFVN